MHSSATKYYYSALWFLYLRIKWLYVKPTKLNSETSSCLKIPLKQHHTPKLCPDLPQTCIIKKSLHVQTLGASYQWKIKTNFKKFYIKTFDLWTQRFTSWLCKARNIGFQYFTPLMKVMCNVTLQHQMAVNLLLPLWGSLITGSSWGFRKLDLSHWLVDLFGTGAWGWLWGSSCFWAETLIS